MSAAARIIEGLKDAIAGNFASVTIDGQHWVRRDWLPIATAPKDGTRVLLIEADQPGDACTGWWQMGAWRDFGDIGCNGLEDYQPTHWMPLPDGDNEHHASEVREDDKR